MIDSIICGDCLEVMPQIARESIDLIILDPPYYKIQSANWDNCWRTFDDYLEFITRIATEGKRVLKNNGSFYVFGDDKNIAYIQTRLDKLGLILLNHIVWYKRNNIWIKYWKGFRSFVPAKEHILFYSLHDKTGLTQIYGNDDCFKQIREYMYQEKQAAKLTNKQINQLVGAADTGGGVACHYFPKKHDYNQWRLPTEARYKKLQTTGYFSRDYEDMRREYEDQRREYEDLRRVFHTDEYITDVWDIPIITGAENKQHPAQKKLEVIERMILTSTNEGGTVLDPTAGSGTTAVACRKTNRHYICIEKEQEYCAIAEKRINEIL